MKNPFEEKRRNEYISKLINERDEAVANKIDLEDKVAHLERYKTLLENSVRVIELDRDRLFELSECYKKDIDSIKAILNK